MKSYTDYMDNISVDAELHEKIMKRTAQTPSPLYRKPVFRYAGLAACAAVVLLCVWTIPGLFNTPIENIPNNPGVISTNTPPSDANTVIPGLPDEVCPDEADMPEPPHRVDIPKVELPENTDGMEMDMIGLFVYQGRIYTQAAWYYNDDAQYIVDNLVGEKVGFAKGNINEWSTQDEYATEFAGSAHGDVYTVNGYGPWYRLCITGSYEDDNGNDVQWVNFYECLNGYGMTPGYDLFVFRSLMDALNGEILSQNWSHVKYQNHDNWNYEKHAYRDLPDVSDEDITSFLYEVFFGEFEDVRETFYINDFYKNGNQTHLYIHMNDGTVVELRLFEGGYVGYRHLGWYFVKIPGEAFDTVFNACK
jgi:hypothetical protein